MPVTLEQARALDALDRHGTFMAAAAALKKGHTAVLYALRTLEERTGLGVLDRRGYRTRLSPAGRRLLVECRRLLAAERGFEAACDEIRQGWEPDLKIVFDGIVPVEPILRVVGALASEHAPTRIDVRAEFLAGVEETFWREEADLMVSVLPPREAGLTALTLAPVCMSLVARRDHALARRAARREDLETHVLLTVRGSDPRLELPTAALDQRSTVHLNDFSSKKTAILAGIGFGWLPDGLAAPELARGILRRIRWRGASTHELRPRLYHRTGVPLGRAANRVIDALDARR
jgi:DNA-binding transcriptional LysR family regulator